MNGERRTDFLELVIQHSIWANQELYRGGNSDMEFYGILEKNMRPVYDSARRQGYDVWDRRLVG